MAITFELINRLGIITLCRPEALNAMNLAMITAMLQTLEDWQSDDQVVAVLIHSNAPRAFCAGGDIREVYAAHRQNFYPPATFFLAEYQLNQAIRNYAKPYIALMQGFTMGGGVGVSVYGSWRVAAPSLRWAMPETSIGYFPDVGSSYFLSRLPHEIGIFLGLTGWQMTAQDLHYLGLAEAIVPEIHFDQLIATLCKSPQLSLADIKTYTSPLTLSPQLSWISQQTTWIEYCFKENMVEEIIDRLREINIPAAKDCLARLRQASPTSLRVTLAQLRRGKTLSFADCMAMETKLANRFVQQPDFYEGIRAKLIDKDYQPRWQSVNEDLNAYFGQPS